MSYKKHFHDFFGIFLFLSILVNYFDTLFSPFQIRSMTKGIEESMRESSGPGSRLPNSLRTKERVITKMLMIIFFTFLLTYIPSFVVKWVSAVQNGKCDTFHQTFFYNHLNDAVSMASQRGKSLLQNGPQWLEHCDFCSKR